MKVSVERQAGLEAEAVMGRPLTGDLPAVAALVTADALLPHA